MERFRKIKESILPCGINNIPNEFMERRKTIIEYFIDHPEELMEHGVFYDFNYSREQIIGSLKGNLYNSPSKGYATVVIL